MDLDPSPVQVYNCYSVTVRVPVIVKTCNTQRISYLLWSEFLIITQIRFWKKSRVNLIYPNYLFSRTKISHRQIQIDPLFHIYIFPSPNPNFSTFWEKWSWTPTGCISVYDRLCVWAQHTPMRFDGRGSKRYVTNICCSKMLDHSNRHAHQLQANALVIYGGQSLLRAVQMYKLLVKHQLLRVITKSCKMLHEKSCLIINMPKIMIFKVSTIY